MSKQEFMKEFDRLCEYYSKKITDKEILNLYYNKVKDKSVEQFKNQINEIIASSKFMPKIADLDEKAKVGIHQRNYSEEDLNQYLDTGK